jgi:hypothetical protein
MQIFDGHASIFCLASMFQIWFRASTKTYWLPVYYSSFCTGICKFLMGLPVQNDLPVCFKFGSVPVQKHIGCRYIIFHFGLANANFGLPVQSIVTCTGTRFGFFVMQHEKIL